MHGAVMVGVVRRSRSDERGIALIVVLVVMLILLLLSSVVVSASIGINQSTTRSRSGVVALEAAQAGLSVATYRINQDYAALTSTNCLQTSSGILSTATPSLESGTYCAPVTSSAGPGLASGATYKYWVSAPMSSGSCGSIAVTSSSSLINRCLVSVGSDNGVNRRLVEVLNAATGSSTSFNGITGLGGVSITENSKGSVAGYPSGQTPVYVNSPNAFMLTQCSPTPSVLYEPAPGATNGSDSSCNPGISNASPAATSQWPSITQASLLPYLSGTSFGSGDTSLSANNDDSVLTTDGFNYNSTTRVVTDNTNSILTLSGTNPRANSGGYWVINVCSVNFTHAGTGVVLNNGAKLYFLVDSSSRTVNGSAACSATYNPPLTLTNVNGWNYSQTTQSACSNPPGTPGNASALWILVGGSGNQALSMSNAQGFSGVLWAPGWNLDFTGGGGCRSEVWYGAIATDGSILANNGLDFHGEPESPAGGGSQTSVFAHEVPQGWAECQSTYDSSNPDHSC